MLLILLLMVGVLALGCIALACLIVGGRAERSWHESEHTRMPYDEHRDAP
jgi:hypothetical protein